MPGIPRNRKRFKEPVLSMVGPNVWTILTQTDQVSLTIYSYFVVHATPGRIV